MHTALSSRIKGFFLVESYVLTTRDCANSRLELPLDLAKSENNKNIRD